MDEGFDDDGAGVIAKPSRP
jgi:hypothetical protein